MSTCCHKSCIFLKENKGLVSYSSGLHTAESYLEFTFSRLVGFALWHIELNIRYMFFWIVLLYTCGLHSGMLIMLVIRVKTIHICHRRIGLYRRIGL